jgi:undecaprenyl-diphosphatase
VRHGGAITVFDLHVVNWMHAHATPLLTSFMLLITHIHSTPGLLMLALLTCIFLFRERDWYWLVAVLAAVPAGMIINAMMKLVFQRPRPVFGEPLLTLATYSFPSGHAAGSTLFYGVLAAYLISRIASRRRRILIIVLAGAQVALVCLSRVYLGVHYPSDVVAGVVEGLAWLVFTLTAVAILRRWRARRETAA